MKKLRPEIKLAIGLGVIFLIILIIVLLRNNVFNNVVDSIRTQAFIDCQKNDYENGIKFEYNVCTVSDQDENSYTLSYIQIDSKDSMIQRLNKKFRENYEKAKQNIEYINKDGKYKLEVYNSINYDIYSNGSITSIIIKDQKYIESYLAEVEDYTVYNIDVKTGKLLTDDDMRNLLNITREVSSKVRSAVINMYATKYKYYYYNPTGMVNLTYNKSIEGVVLSSISNIFVDSKGEIFFIHSLFNPSRGEETPYIFKIDKDQNVTILD